MARHWYVYQLFDAETKQVVYVGKGTRYRLSSSLRGRTKQYGRLMGEKIASFIDEAAAYSYEKEIISQLKPMLNKSKGGNGGFSGKTRITPKSIEREDKIFYKECEMYGTRWMACKVLMNYLGYFPMEKAKIIKQQYYDGLKKTKVYKCQKA